MNYPGASHTSGMGGFPGANMLTNQLLNPTSLQARKQQLVNRLVTGQDRRRTVLGGGGANILFGMAGNPFAASLLQMGYGNDPGGQFYGSGPPETPNAPSPQSSTSTDVPGGAATSLSESTPSTGIEQVNAPSGGGSIGGITGGFNPSKAIDPAWLTAILGHYVAGNTFRAN